jgi:subtilisin family serine protease
MERDTRQKYGLREIRWWHVAAIMCCACVFSRAVLADTYVIPDRYVVQRTARTVAALADEEINYTVVGSHEHFDVVAPPRSVRQAYAQSAPERELLNPAKVAADCAEILKDSTVETCEPDAVYYPSAVPNDPSFYRQWFLDDSAHDGDVEAPTAWDYGTGVADVLIGVVDTGIFTTHPDLVDNLWSNPSDPVDGMDNDGNGYTDDVFGINSATGSSDPSDPHGHGTHVAGIIGARGNNGAGVSGVMWRVSLIAVSATTSASGALSTSSLVAGLDYFHGLKSRGHNIRAVNASWGGYVYSSAVFNAVSRLNDDGILLVCAAGNDGTNNDTNPHYPSNYDFPNVISVGATGPTRLIAGYSNYGDSVDIAAPGGDSDFGADGYMYSTYRSATPGQAVYSSSQGTSMAAPVVTGALGLLASQNGSLTAAELRSLLISSADTLTALTPYVGQGRFLNIGAMSIVNGGGVDECPSDPAKVFPGICGCGVSDTDANGNGTADCLDPPDYCPEDTLKLEPGVCGCGVADDDLNLNGTVDCLDPKVLGVVPAVPTVKGVKGKATASLTPMGGVTYVLKVTTLAPMVKGKPKPKAKVVYVTATSPSYSISRLKAKTKVSVSYAYVLQGTPLQVSRYSSTKTVTVK